MYLSRITRDANVETNRFWLLACRDILYDTAIALDLIRHQPARIIFVIDFLRLRDPRHVRFSYAYVRAVPGTRIDEIPNINCITMVIESAERRLFEQ